MNDTEETGGSRSDRQPVGVAHADLYRKEWATLTGRSESDIYVPEALREETNEDE